MKLLLKYSCLILLIFSSCNKKQELETNEIVVSYKSDKQIKASSFIEDFKIVQLSTDDDNLIFQISKIQYLNENIYIHDLPGNCVFIFNDDGTLHKKLDKRGAGPGEYVQITDFFVDGDDLLVLDITQQAILRYDNDLEFVDKTNFRSLASTLIAQNNSYFIYNEPSNRNPDYQFTLLNEDGEPMKEFLPRIPVNHFENYAGVNVFALKGKENYLSPRFNDTIYSISGNDINPEFIINFEKHKFPTNENINSYDIFDLDFPYMIKRNFYVSNKYLIFDYLRDRNRLFCIHNKESNTTQSGEIDNDLITDFRFFPRWGNDNYLIEELGSEMLIEHFKSSPQFEKFTDVNVEDNPFVIIYTLKLHK